MNSRVSKKRNGIYGYPKMTIAEILTKINPTEEMQVRIKTVLTDRAEIGQSVNERLREGELVKNLEICLNE